MKLQDLIKHGKGRPTLSLPRKWANEKLENAAPPARHSGGGTYLPSEAGQEMTSTRPGAFDHYAVPSIGDPT